MQNLRFTSGFTLKQTFFVNRCQQISVANSSFFSWTLIIKLIWFNGQLIIKIMDKIFVFHFCSILLKTPKYN